MQIRVKSADVRYEATFASPAIDLVSSSSSLLRSVFGKFAPRYTVRSDDVRITNSPVVSEYRLTVDLFNRNAQLLLTADKAALSYRSLSSADDIHVVTDSSAILLACVKAALTETKVSQESVSMSVGFTVDPESPESFQSWKAKYLPRPADLTAPDGIRLFAGRKLALRNTDARWTIDFYVDETWQSENEVFVSTTALFFSPDDSFELEQKAKLLQEYIGWLFRSLALTVIPKA